MEVSRSHDADPLSANCPGREIFEMITSRWALLILWALKDDTLRFHRLRDRVEGISDRVLSENLKTLRRNGLINRHVEPTVPPQVSYSLTDASEELLVVMTGLTGWIGRQLPTIEQAQQRYDETEG